MGLFWITKNKFQIRSKINLISQTKALSVCFMESIIYWFSEIFFLLFILKILLFSISQERCYFLLILSFKLKLFGKFNYKKGD
jgi:hypothetical protein